jgi:hypothetical protein
VRIVVMGYLVRGPLGGIAWHYLQYVLGLARLGHDVYFVEDSDDYASCYDPVRNVVDVDPTYGLRFTADAFERVGLVDRWAYHDAHRARWLGPAADRIAGVCQTADLLIDVSLVNPLRDWALEIPIRAAIDTDPAFTQIRHLTDARARERAAHHTHFFSFGENIATRQALIPDDGFPWQPTRQPVVLDMWPVTAGAAEGRFTSVMLWNSYAAEELGGQRYGLKSESFEPYLDLPRQVLPSRDDGHDDDGHGHNGQGHDGPLFELALGGHTFPKARLEDHGWRTVDPRAPTRDPWTYQRYIQQSKAEFSVAKHGYVVARSGWFSERSAAYLASARPVVVQDTGFSTWLRADGGVLPFTTPDEARDAIEAVNARYDFHCQQARMVAETYFDAGRVLTDLLERSMTRDSRAEELGTVRGRSVRSNSFSA